MAALLEFDQSNGAVEVVTHAVATGYHGSADVAELDRVVYRLQAGTNGVELWHRLHVTDLGGSIQVGTVRVYADAPGAGISHKYNGHEVQGTYDASKRTSFLQPGTGTTRTPNTMPTSVPVGANLGIAGSLTGALVAPGWTDYLVHQFRVPLTATGTIDQTLYAEYEDVG